MKPKPLFKIGETVRIDPSKIADKSQPMIGTVVKKSFGWWNRDGRYCPVWRYELSYPVMIGSPIILLPETCLLKND